jgi:hypothetical protein
VGVANRITYLFFLVRRNGYDELKGFLIDLFERLRLLGDLPLPPPTRMFPNADIGCVFAVVADLDLERLISRAFLLADSIVCLSLIATETSRVCRSNSRDHPESRVQREIIEADLAAFAERCSRTNRFTSTMHITCALDGESDSLHLIYHCKHQK